MHIEKIVKTFFLFICVVTSISGCAYNQRKSDLANERQSLYDHAYNIDKTKNKLIEENKVNVNLRDALLKEIENMKTEVSDLKLKLKKLQKYQNNTKEKQENICNKNCREVKIIENQIKDLEKSIKIKENQIKVL